jgi:hypothetical protein
VKNWFQGLPFKCNLRRYTEDSALGYNYLERAKVGAVQVDSSVDP